MSNRGLPQGMNRYSQATLFSAVGTATFRSLIPIVAVTTLGADPSVVGILNALSMIGVTLLGIPIGVLVDRSDTRRMMITADLARAGLLVMIPVFALSDSLSVWALGVVCLGVGVAEVFFMTANSTRIPGLVPPDKLPLAFGRVKAASTLGEVASPGAAGALLLVVLAPFVALLSVVAYLLSALLFQGTESEELHSSSRSRPDRKHFLVEAWEGLKYSLSHPILRALLLSGMTASTGAMFMNALNVAYLSSVVGMSAALIAFVTLTQGIGGFFGATLAPRLIKAFGEGTTKIVATGAVGLPVVGYFFAPQAGAAGGWVIAVSSVLGGFVVTVAGVAGSSVPARVTPRPMLGRVIGCNRTFALGIMPLASVVGGFVVTAFGYDVGLVSVAVLALAASVILLISPLRDWRGSRTVKAPE